MNSKQQFGQITASLTQSKLKIKEIEKKARLKNSEHQLDEHILHHPNYAAKLFSDDQDLSSLGKNLKHNNALNQPIFKPRKQQDSAISIAAPILQLSFSNLQWHDLFRYIFS